MAVKMRVRITGASELTRRLNVLGEKAKEVIEPATRAGAEVIRKAASDNAAKGKYATGELADHIVAEVKDVQPLKATIAVGPDKDHFYGLFVEFGHALVRGRR
ncbi:HK97-gp10 family putative phage morphogenesis protein, partial [Marinobacter sp.]|uniref:HK97-gp10 family putative phage morphogenesis protein n=1 Tax=Marinobacter sp. TaxID=50741 RepID=UPI00199838B4